MLPTAAVTGCSPVLSSASFSASARPLPRRVHLLAEVVVVRVVRRAVHLHGLGAARPPGSGSRCRAPSGRRCGRRAGRSVSGRRGRRSRSRPARATLWPTTSHSSTTVAVGGRRDQAVVQHPVRTPVVAALGPDEAAEREDAEADRRPRVRAWRRRSRRAAAGSPSRRAPPPPGASPSASSRWRTADRRRRPGSPAGCWCGPARPGPCTPAAACSAWRCRRGRRVGAGVGRGLDQLLSAASSMSCSYRSRESAVSWPPARKPLEAAVLASASER